MRLTVDALSVSRGERTLVRDLSFTLRPGEAAALVGPNGAGKTTLLRAIAGLIRPDAGMIAFHDGDAPLESEDARARLHWVGWQDGLKTGRGARDELRFWAAWAGAEAAAADAALETVGLAAAADLDVRRLSVGQRRRLALASLLTAPRTLWLLDEPLAPLDDAWRARFGELMAAHLAGGGAILVAAHDPLPIPAREITVGTQA